MLYLPEHPDAFKFHEFLDPEDATQYIIYFGISGALPNTTVGSMIVYYNIEFIPDTGIRPFTALAAPTGAYAT
jgi:hypothetical protein